MNRPTIWGRRAGWILLNATFAVGIWAGFYEHVEWARNLTAFWVWFAVINSVTSFVPENRARLRAKGPYVPTKISFYFELLCALALAAVGEFILAGLTLFDAFLTSSLYGKSSSADAEVDTKDEDARFRWMDCRLEIGHSLVIVRELDGSHMVFETDLPARRLEGAVRFNNGRYYARGEGESAGTALLSAMREGARA